MNKIRMSSNITYTNSEWIKNLNIRPYTVCRDLMGQSMQTEVCF